MLIALIFAIIILTLFYMLLVVSKKEEHGGIIPMGLVDYIKSFAVYSGPQINDKKYRNRQNELETPLSDFRWITVEHALFKTGDTVNLKWASSFLKHNYVDELPSELVVVDGKVTFPIMIRLTPEELEYGLEVRRYEQIFLTVYHQGKIVVLIKFVVWYDNNLYEIQTKSA